MTLLANLAQVEFDQRLAAARRMRAERRWTAEEANARVILWLAVALAAGAEPREAASELEYLRRDPATRDTARATLATRLCEPAEMRAELARARDAAVAAAIAAPTDQPRAERSIRLQYLAVLLGCRGTVLPEPMREAA